MVFYYIRKPAPQLLRVYFNDILFFKYLKG